MMKKDQHQRPKQTLITMYGKRKEKKNWRKMKKERENPIRLSGTGIPEMTKTLKNIVQPGRRGGEIERLKWKVLKWVFKNGLLSK